MIVCFTVQIGLIAIMYIVNARENKRVSLFLHTSAAELLLIQI